ncbi:hypothetical protein HN51_050143 [Arachis hypogaea]
MAVGAKFLIIDSKGNSRTTLAENFFLGYRKVDLASGEILLSVFLPWNKRFEYVKEFKQSHRKDDDIAIVNAGMCIQLQETSESWVVADASIAYGGVAPCSLSAKKAKGFLVGKVWDQNLLQDALKVLQNDILLKDDAPGGMVEFRKSLTLSFLFKFFLWVSHQLDGVKESIPASHLSAVHPVHHPTITGSQDYEIMKHGHLWVLLRFIYLQNLRMLDYMFNILYTQVTGEAEYADDIQLPSNGFHAALVLSRKPHARILSIDDGSEAMSSHGFVGLFLAKDVLAHNKIEPVVYDEELFATEYVTCVVFQVIGVVVADTHENAKAAARKVNVKYEDLPAILSIKEAINAGSFHPNAEKCLIKGQELFYLEPHSSLVWTLDGGNEVHMISSTQAPQKHQKYVSHVLGLPMSKIVCKTKRIGGGFGGKETRSAFIAAAASLPAYLLNWPVKLTLDRDVDMMITGQRHSFLGKYKVRFTNEGSVLALDLEIYNNAGNSLDPSLAILERAMFHSDNVYYIPNMRITGKVCFTNFPSHTAFRGFGGPQGMLITENWIHRIADELKMSSEEIKQGYISHYGQQLEHCTLHQLWNELKLSCDFVKACEQVDLFNSHNCWKKRAIAMVPTKFGISFTTKLMNQVITIYNHGRCSGSCLYRWNCFSYQWGVEMGQGLHTKVAQIAASAFNIPLSSVFISDTSTDKVPNSSPTAASASSDMYGAAVLDACEQIKARMEPVASRNNFNSFAELAVVCFAERIDLSGHGFFITPDIGFDWKMEWNLSNKVILEPHTPFRYFTYGAAFSEVEIDTLTGDFHTRVASRIMVLVLSRNPAIDVGQTEGAFIQGLGWLALELKWGDAAHKWISPGCLYTCGPGAYKIPSINDVPLKFNVSLLKAIHSSKAVGEPPFFLASAVFFAIKDAIRAARLEVGWSDWFPLDNPATPERIRMACLDDIASSLINSDFHPTLRV